MEYKEFLESKRHRNEEHGFAPVWIPDFLYPFESHLVDWAVRIGRGAIFADCGLGKTPMQLVWAENIVRKTNRRVLVIAPLAVSPQTMREGEKFGIEVKQSREGELRGKIIITNYQRLHYFDPKDFIGAVVDESSILKAFDGKTRRMITDFLNQVNYRLLCTATPAPNDFMELGTSSEALGIMKYVQMLAMYFVNDCNESSKWRVRGHAKKKFWHWVSTWARAIRRPSDLGFDDDRFVLPPLTLNHYILKSDKPDYGFWAPLARTLEEQRMESKKSIKRRCEKVAELACNNKDRPFIAWCHYNPEGDLLEKMIPGSVQVAGRNSDEEKESRLDDFSKGNIRVLITKPSIAGFGLNWQHCSDVSFFPSHSWERWYQAIRRCWRFGQTREVKVNIIATESEQLILDNMSRKEREANEIYDGIIREMRDFQLGIEPSEKQPQEMETPAWL